MSLARIIRWMLSHRSASVAAPPRGRSLAQYMPAAVHERRLVEMTADQRAQIAERLDAEWSAHMVAAQAGDRIAYEHLLRGCVPLIRRVVGRQDVRLDRIDDITQEVLLTLHRARHTYDPSRSFSAWLCTIAKRRAIDSLRRRGRQDRHEIYEPIAYESHPEAESGREDLGETANQAVSDALDQLPPGQREAIEALALRQLSLDEASAFTGKSKCTLKVNIHRALKILRARFG